MMNFDKKAINSPFRYAGGKFYARKLILEHIPPHRYYCEPFAGGASIFFAKEKARYNWLNDIDVGLINCLEAIKENPQLLSERLENEVASKERHAFYKNDYQAKTTLDEAVRWYYLNRTSYSGIMNMKNCYFGYGDKFSMRPENWGKNIYRTSSKLKDVKLTSWDFEKVINNVPDGAFLFIDPPYYNADQDKFYTHAFSKEDHVRLAKCLQKNSDRIKFLLTYDNVVDIRKFYNWTFAMHDKEWNYMINRTDDQKNGTNNKGTRYKGKELFIVNYDSISEGELTFKFNES